MSKACHLSYGYQRRSAGIKFASKAALLAARQMAIREAGSAMADLRGRIDNWINEGGAGDEPR